ncbi:MAG: hypothetical protein HC880_00565 [Bacteroidia bacterium]|nr:hypothetical protein [Bacteroidia bacterium]
MHEAIGEVSFTQVGQALYRGAGRQFETFAGLDCQAAHLLGQDMVAVLSVVVGLGEVQAAVKSGKFVQTLGKLALEGGKNYLRLLVKLKNLGLKVVQQGQKVLIYASRQGQELIASIEQGLLRIEKELNDFIDASLVGSFDEVKLLTPEGQTVTTQVELWQKGDRHYIKSSREGGSTRGGGSNKYPNQVPKVSYSIFNPQQAIKINLETSAWSQASKDFGRYEEVVYILYRTDTKEYLKVGSTKDLIERFKKYVTAGNKLEIPLELEIYRLSELSQKAGITDRIFYETTLRNKTLQEGHLLSWDNTDFRLGKPGQGTPENEDGLESLLHPPLINVQMIFDLSQAKK